MTVKKQRVWLIGASAGIGLALCQKYLAAGYCVIASSRQASQASPLLSLKRTYSQSLQLLDFDVEEAIASADYAQERCHAAWQFFEGLDIWFYNVGLYQPMRMDEWKFADFQQMNNANYLGAVVVMIALKKCMPRISITKSTSNVAMQWIWNLSLAADYGLPYGGGYSAPKAALMNLAESLQPELAQAGIQLQVINHGFVKTRLTAKNDFAMPGLMEAEEAAEKIFASATKSHPRFETRFPFGLALFLGTLRKLPKSWALALSRKMLRKPGE